MEEWESYLHQIIGLPISDTYRERGLEVKDVLLDLAKYPFDLANQHKNIRKNEDFPRNELIGAVQRYVYGNFLDAIAHSCSSVEIGLLVRLDQSLTTTQKNSMKYLTLGDTIRLAYRSSILKRNSRLVKKATEAILELRNIQAHPINFVAGLVTGYKKYNEVLSKIGIDSTTIEKGFGTLLSMLPNETAKSLAEKYELADIISGMKVMESLSTFEWCSNRRYIKSVKHDLDEIVKDFISALMSGTGDLTILRSFFRTLSLGEER